MSLRKTDLDPVTSASAADQQAGKEPRLRFCSGHTVPRCVAKWSAVFGAPTPRRSV